MSAVPRSTLHSLLLALCALPLLAAADDPSRPGGDTSVNRQDRNAFALPSANLSAERKLDFAVGNSFFRNPWVIAPTATTARDGLGPLFNTNACINCHIRDGRGHPPEPGASQAVSMLVRLSIPASAADGDRLREFGVIPEPVYGGQFQDMAIPGVAPEGRVRVDYTPVTLSFADGSQVELRKPRLRLSDLGYGPLHPQVLTSARIAPPMIGLGLLEAIPEADLLAAADPDDRNGDGISGRPNLVWDMRQGQTRVGRFGWKAGQPNVEQQSVRAFADDMGLTTVQLPHTDCSATQTACLQAVDGGTPEVSEHILSTVVFYSRNLAVPRRRNLDDPRVAAGEALFAQAGCAGCHTPRQVTRSDALEPELAGQVIYPYTDLLLHDMGEGLADGRSEFQASGSEWRTPPLWGIGLTETVSGHTQFLHDGRARNLLEAVLWHGGEAEAARQRVLQFDASQREALLAFLNSL